MRMLKCAVVMSLIATFGDLYAADQVVTQVVVEDCKQDEKAEQPSYAKGLTQRIEAKNQKKFYVRLPDGADSAIITEEKRLSRIAKDVKTVIEAVAGTPRQAAAAPTEPQNKCVRYDQRYDRSTISIRPRKSSDDKRDFGEVTYIVGPREHWYLAADMGLNNIKQATFSQATNSVIEKSRTAGFYISVNYKVGDVYTSADAVPRLSFDRLSFKVLVNASTKPMESYGAGVGYDLPWWDGLSVFVARVWTKADASVGGAGLGVTPSNLVGISYDVSKALDSLKSK